MNWPQVTINDMKETNFDKVNANGYSSQKQTNSICKKLPLSTIGYPLSISVTNYQQSVTLFAYEAGYTLTKRCYKAVIETLATLHPYLATLCNLDNACCFASNVCLKNLSQNSSITGYTFPTISYTYRQAVTLCNCKAVYLPNLSNTYKYLKPYWNGNPSQKQTISICKKLHLSTISYTFPIISYTYRQAVTLFRQLVTLLSTISYTFPIISYTCRSTSTAAIAKMTNPLKLLKLKEKLVINKWSFL